MSQLSQFPGMGSRRINDTTSFRVWAPHATNVHVAGDFNQWNPNTHPLTSEGNHYWSADIPEAEPGHEYKYVITNPFTATPVWKRDPYNKDITNTVGNSIIHQSSFDWSDQTPFSMPYYNELVIYELHIGTFNDSPGGPVGQFATAIERLPHLVELGVNAVQVMPAKEYPGPLNWGYAVTDPFAVESDYGDIEGLKAFVKATHNHGMAVILDVVYNHFGPGDLNHSLRNFDGWGENGLGGIYFYNDWRAQTPWGDTRPDYGRGEVRQYLRDNLLYWLEECQIDGVRWDATAYIRNAHGTYGEIPDGWSLMQWMNSEAKSRQPWKISIAEDLQNDAAITRPTWSGGAGFDSQWHPEFVHPVREVLTTPQDETRDLNKIHHALTSYYNGSAPQRVIYTESHDEVALNPDHPNKRRLADQIWPGNATDWSAKKRSLLGAVLVFTSPGIPMIFQGQELFENRQWQDSLPIDWSYKETYSGIFHLYRDLIRLRRNWHNHTRGLRGNHINVFHMNHTDKVIAYHRWDQGGMGDDVIVVLNLSGRVHSNYQIGMPTGGTWWLRFNSDWAGYDPSFGNHPSFDTTAYAEPRDGLAHTASIHIEAYSALIYSQ
ncbi:MAG: alpha-amylase family glycosyl hydrolase [Verrucomicrobiota bacterium]